ncbi:MAG: exopolysaccharide biosynthesis glycosyltransferase VpsL [Gammaproteobacteria bacterium]
MLAAWITVAVLLVILGTLTKTNALFSRYWMGLWFILGVLFIVSFRTILTLSLHQMRKHGWNHRRIVIVGTGSLSLFVSQRLREAPWTGLDIVAYFSDRSGEELGELTANAALFTLDSLGPFLAENTVDEIWLTLPLSDEEKVQSILHSLRHCTATIRYVPDIFGFRLLNHAVTEIAGMPVLDLNVSPMLGMNRVIKELEDRLLALLILVLTSPLLVLIAIGVKLSSPGPVLFKQLRHGWDGKPIKVYKFRTMFVHQEENGQVTQAQRNDPRITRFGTFLRRTSLDELPQFFNVLQGRMSIVGPRPHAIAHNEQYKDLIDDYMLRHKVKPGITGWAQVNGWRGETSDLDKMKKRVEYDLYYIENWSLLFDLKIIFLTIFRGFVHQNAY